MNIMKYGDYIFGIQYLPCICPTSFTRIYKEIPNKTHPERTLMVIVSHHLIRVPFSVFISSKPDPTSLDGSHNPVIYLFGLVCLLTGLVHLPVFQTWKILCTRTHLHTHKLCVAGWRTQSRREHQTFQTIQGGALLAECPPRACEMPV